MEFHELVDAPFTYAEVGATAGELPAGYRHVRESYPIGRGRARFDEAAAAVMRWGMLRGAGVKVHASTEVARPGSVVLVGVGPLRAPCRVVYVIAEEHERGFAYGTLAGHPEAGEERFAVRYDADTDVVFAEVTAFSRHATWWSRAAGPITSLAQGLITRRYLNAV
ncbi:DUF1990 domain-containing protein [Mycobacterium sp. MYCO198283]|uniref:DUF1990 domain-containing protein n=1 Tax=Mycobacterium sp. MYCO198283 TaxID=2883505 RepID=UPI001E58619B|nr:DUF1990 domain-containing protein [Mycobacterium sp. MYCO198283]MCG5433681.1 DUF1990 domain-containing protein [Mycobacterium sp. MYCO198283]